MHTPVYAEAPSLDNVCWDGQFVRSDSRVAA